MKYTTALIIFFSSLGALVTEIIIGAIMGVSLSMAGQREMATGTIIFFWILTTLTIASGPLALIGATV